MRSLWTGGLIVFVLIVELIGAGEAQAGKFSVVGLNDENEVQEFLTHLQRGLQAHDVHGVAKMVHLPITVYRDKIGTRIASRSDLIKKFDQIFDEDITSVVLCQSFDDLWANWRGVSVGRGQIWMNLVYLKDRKHFDADSSRDDFNDRHVWKLEIVGINGGKIAHEEAERCAKKAKSP